MENLDDNKKCYIENKFIGTLFFMNNKLVIIK